MFYDNYYRIKSYRDIDKDLFLQLIWIPITGLHKQA